ncbi:hypothetical protein VNO77_22692 [Canavalia gladiata]|uniref:Uncharacterized protein n=1 Tax=Canavalia gladiata TaxID=3824 RepID=A0AAN9Q885_CANGL
MIAKLKICSAIGTASSFLSQNLFGGSIPIFIHKPSAWDSSSHRDAQHVWALFPSLDLNKEIMNYLKSALCSNKEDYEDATIWIRELLIVEVLVIRSVLVEEWTWAVIMQVGCMELVSIQNIIFSTPLSHMHASYWLGRIFLKFITISLWKQGSA